MSLRESSFRDPEDQARAIVRVLHGRKRGVGWECQCPAHDDRRPSLALHVRDRKLLVCCRAGCPKEAVIDALRDRGLWGSKVAHTGPGRERPAVQNRTATPRDVMKSWRCGSPFIRDAPPDLYLRGRGLDLTDPEASAFRIAPSLWHWPSKTRWPALLACVALADGTPITVHQTFVEPDGSGKAPLDKSRLFAAGGKTIGGGVWFGVADPEREFIVGEGIESSLSAMRIYGVDAGCAALSAIGIARLILPHAARLVRVFADHDRLGQGLEAAREAGRRWCAEGRATAATMAPTVGEDANDVWRRNANKIWAGRQRA